MHPEIAKTLVEQRRDELTHTRTAADSGQAAKAGSSWFSRHLPQWHVSWSRTVLSPAELPIGVVTALIGAPAFVWVLRGTRPVGT